MTKSYQHCIPKDGKNWKSTRITSIHFHFRGMHFLFPMAKSQSHPFKNLMFEISGDEKGKAIQRNIWKSYTSVFSLRQVIVCRNKR